MSSRRTKESASTSRSRSTGILPKMKNIVLKAATRSRFSARDLSSSTPSMLYLRVNRRHLCLFPDATEDDPNPLPSPPLAGTTGTLNVIIANVDDLQPFSSGVADWLITVARLIFEPLGTGSLYTFTTETLEYWLGRDMDAQWRQVLPGEELRATIYEFRPVNDFVTMTKMSLRHQRSRTSPSSTQHATRFRADCLRRDRRCVISEATREASLVASHLIPKRIGDSGVQSIVQRFTESNDIVDVYDARIGVMLFSGLDCIVDSYELGFWNNGPNQYVIHDFLDRRVAISGLEPRGNEEMCHGAQISLSHNGTSINPPPVGVFHWNYIQCVLKRFSTADYRNFGNVFYFVRPFRTTDDDDESDHDFDDPRNIKDPPYPSFMIDLAQAKALQRLEDAERVRGIVAWNFGVSASNSAT